MIHIRWIIIHITYPHHHNYDFLNVIIDTPCYISYQQIVGVGSPKIMLQEEQVELKQNWNCSASSIKILKADLHCLQSSSIQVFDFTVRSPIQENRLQLYYNSEAFRIFRNPNIVPVLDRWLNNNNGWDSSQLEQHSVDEVSWMSCLYLPTPELLWGSNEMSTGKHFPDIWLKCKNVWTWL